MNPRSLILLVGALIIAGFTAMLARSLMIQQSAAPQQVEQAPAEKQVLVAVKLMPRGTIVEAAHVAWKHWPDNAIDETMINGAPGDETKIFGKVARTDIAAGQPVPSAGLVGPGERGFLAAALQPGMRAITISISDTSGVAGFVFPGDRVDLVLTHQVDQGDRGQIRVSETVLQNVRVLAIDQDVNDREDQPKVGRTVTLEVTPKLVEKIAVMQLIGSVSLSLRSLPEQAVAAAAHDAAAPDPVALAASARVATDKAGKPAKTPVAASIKRDPKMPWDDVQTYTLGKEVSKFASAVRTNSDAGSAPVSAAPAAPAPAASAPKPSGPSIIVNRGAETTQVAAGGR
ncbi:MAG: Flp pilus assembly protein CpaB [Sphingomonadales bacterium]|nr:MAG: Flp pilus assembly protein CpaB [Sphingomonadales bacterium]